MLPAFKFAPVPAAFAREETGISSRCEVTGEVRQLPEAVDLTAYRVIQESLTNTAKHAAGAVASVLVVLEEVMTKRRPTAGTYSLLAAMGPGFCSELVLLRW